MKWLKQLNSARKSQAGDEQHFKMHTMVMCLGVRAFLMYMTMARCEIFNGTTSGLSAYYNLAESAG
jgi:hypothetical protein